MFATKTLSALLVFGFAALPLASAEAQPKNPVDQYQQQQVVEGRNATYLSRPGFDQNVFSQAAANARAAIRDQVELNARSTH